MSLNLKLKTFKKNYLHQKYSEIIFVSFSKYLNQGNILLYWKILFNFYNFSSKQLLLDTSTNIIK